MNVQSDQFSLDMYLLISELNTKIMRIISNCLGKTTRKKQAKKKQVRQTLQEAWRLPFQSYWVTCSLSTFLGEVLARNTAAKSVLN